MQIKRFTTSVGVVLIVIMALLLWRILYLQSSRTDYYQQRSQKQRQSTVVYTSQRGLIVDRNNNMLAASNLIETVFVEPRAIIGDPELVKITAAKLQNILSIPGTQICDLIYKSRNPGYLALKTGITPNLHQAVRQAGLRGVAIQSNWQRYYPTGSLMSHVVGFTGKDNTGLAGLEFKYNEKLSAHFGKDVLIVDSSRKPIAAKNYPNTPEDGSSLILTIDSTIQQFVRKALLKQYKDFNAESATAIVMDPWTGAILAMVSLPDFDASEISSSKPHQRRNRALTDPFEPGSIFKPIVAALALDCGSITKDQVFFCENGNYHGKGFGSIGEWANHKYGNMTVHDILVRSSNIGMAKIGQKMGRKKLHKGIKLFGFGRRTGIDLPGEDAGLVRNVSKWDGYSVTRIPYGHEVSVTSLQIISAYATLANGGSPVTPHLVRAVIDNQGQITEMNIPPRLSGHIIKPEIANWIARKALVAVVNDKKGTGKNAAIEKWQVFGKTGTANISRANVKGYDESNYVASFAGGAPADNPAIVALVSIRKPDKSLRKGYSGGRVAAPVFKEIVENTLNYLELERQRQLLASSY
ncbi:MAG: penicillin-binding protein 2 [Planctomycetes bacterium]|nr:penicillin-binding protein 2 [Planctomycetota bacterium]